MYCCILKLFPVIIFCSQAGDFVQSLNKSFPEMKAAGSMDHI